MKTAFKSITIAAILSIFMSSMNAQAIPTNEKLNLTGTWIEKGNKFTLDQRGCTSGYAGQLITNHQYANEDVEITMIQNGNQLIIPDAVITYWGRDSASYKQQTQGTISGNTVKFITSATPPFGRFTLESIGTVSDDGNTIVGRVLCRGSRGSATAKANFILIKQIPQPQGATSAI